MGLHLSFENKITSLLQLNTDKVVTQIGKMRVYLL